MNKVILFVMMILLVYPVNAKLILPKVLSDAMVLQQNSKVKLWGKANPNTTIEINTEWNDLKVSVKVQKDSTWAISVNTSKAGGPYKIFIQNEKETKILNDILLGEVWLCSGQSNMTMPMKGYNSQPINNALEAIVESERYSEIRMFTAERTISSKKEFDVNGTWKAASVANTPDFSAVGYFYALELYKTLKVPIGIISISWGGSNVQAWMSMENLSMFPEFDMSKIDMNSKTPMRIPTALFNGMFNPVSKFGVKGILWYQGESNLREEALYKKMFPAMVKEWRENVEMGTIPFYYVQIAPYKYDGSNLITSALIREVQLECLDIIPNSGMVVTMDVGDENMIHPAEKAIISKRLSYVALAKTYGYKYLPHKGPVFKTAEVNQDKMLLFFENTGNGFMPSISGIKGFEIAGEDKVFYPAQTKLKNGVEIEVWANEVPNPLYVRYCFRNYALGTLKDSFGLPASSFRTDK